MIILSKISSVNKASKGTMVKKDIKHTKNKENKLAGHFQWAQFIYKLDLKINLGLVFHSLSQHILSSLWILL